MFVIATLPLSTYPYLSTYRVGYNQWETLTNIQEDTPSHTDSVMVASTKAGRYHPSRERVNRAFWLLALCNLLGLGVSSGLGGVGFQASI